MATNDVPLVMLSNQTTATISNSNPWVWISNAVCSFIITTSLHAGPRESEKSTRTWLYYVPQQTVWVYSPVKFNQGIFRSETQVAERFYALLKEWQNATRFESKYSRIMLHPAYRRMIGLGPNAVPLILRELQKGSGGAWFQALEDITGENPIAPEHESDSSLMIADWLNWGKRNGVI